MDRMVILDAGGSVKMRPAPPDARSLLEKLALPQLPLQADTSYHAPAVFEIDSGWYVFRSLRCKDKRLSSVSIDPKRGPHSNPIHTFEVMQNSFYVTTSEMVYIGSFHLRYSSSFLGGRPEVTAESRDNSGIVRHLLQGEQSIFANTRLNLQPRVLQLAP